MCSFISTNNTPTAGVNNTAIDDKWSRAGPFHPTEHLADFLQIEYAVWLARLLLGISKNRVVTGDNHNPAAGELSHVITHVPLL